tara:strand:- start:2426 stop:3697 length:1272 start_codon:yes stop_codon:yes gene_type:complete
MNAIDLLRFNRFDVAAKHLYLRHLDMGYESDFGKYVYSNHIKTWNNFREYDNPSKNSEQSFIDCFKDIHKSIGEDGYRQDLEPVPVTEEGFLLNGAHRLASCIRNGCDIRTEVTEDPKAGQIDCTSYFFLQKGLDYGVCDSIAIEYAKLKENTFIVTVFPVATKKGNMLEVRDILVGNGCKVIYEKGIVLAGHGPVNLMRQLYSGESWGGGMHDGYSGYCLKANYCYKDSVEHPTYAFLVECEEGGKEHMLEVKQKIRDIYGLDKHSVHINDTHEETVNLARVFFNDNSLHFLNNAIIQPFQKYDYMFTQLKEWINSNKYNSDDICITASSVMSAYGMREGQDLDYLYGDGVQPMVGHGLINEHNKEISKYTMGKDEILYDDRNHFYFDGVKFASLNVIHELKEKRSEPKDLVDIKMMKGVLV